MARQSEPDRRSGNQPLAERPSDVPHPAEACDVCGSERVTWHRCKLICENCRTILKSCADL